jgi:hypothetical protein
MIDLGLGNHRSHRDLQDRSGEVMTSFSIVHMYESMGRITNYVSVMRRGIMFLHTFVS